jgi:hypothetical protein
MVTDTPKHKAQDLERLQAARSLSLPFAAEE